MAKPGQYNRPVKKPKPPRPSGGGGGARKRGGGGGGPLYDPSSLLSGRKLKRSAKALTKIELLPALHAYSREASALEAQRQGQERGLTALGQRTGQAVSGAYDALGASSAQTQARQQAVANLLNQNTQNINTQTQQAMTGAQTGQLGDLTQALSARNVEPGGSASQQALANQVQAQQQAAAQRAQGYSQFAASQGADFTGLAAAQGQAEQMRGREAQSAIAQAIMDRIASSNADSSAAIREALGKRADTKALWGPTRLKNLLQLRGSERDFLNAQQSLMGQNQRAKLSASTSRGNALLSQQGQNARSAARGRQQKRADQRRAQQNAFTQQQENKRNKRSNRKGK